MNATLYGIKNCDTVKKARAWLDERGVLIRRPVLELGERLLVGFKPAAYIEAVPVRK